MRRTEPGPARLRVWDPLLRCLHWALAAGVVAGWVTRHGFGRVHEWIGYGVLALVAVRLAWGLFGPEYARFRQFLRSPARTRDYARRALRGRAPRYLGHNPLGGWMTVVLLAMISAVCASGWLYTTDRFWGIAWVENLHDGLTWVLIGLVALHLAGVAWSSLAHGENLVAAMIHGRKRASAADDHA